MFTRPCLNDSKIYMINKSLHSYEQGQAKHINLLDQDGYLLSSSRDGAAITNIVPEDEDEDEREEREPVP